MSRITDSTIIDAIANAIATTGYVEYDGAVEWIIEKTDLVNDTDWHNVDLSAVLPLDAVAVIIGFYLLDNSAGFQIYIDKKDEIDYVQAINLRMTVANITVLGSCVVPCKDGQLSIKCNVAPLTWSNVNLKILGWFL